MDPFSLSTRSSSSGSSNSSRRSSGSGIKRSSKTSSRTSQKKRMQLQAIGVVVVIIALVAITLGVVQALTRGRNVRAQRARAEEQWLARERAQLAKATAKAKAKANANANANAEKSASSSPPAVEPYVPPPKIVWTHWHTSKLPPLQQKNLDRTRRILEPAGWTVNFVTTDSFLDLCPFPFAKFFDLDSTHQCDYIRLWLLAEFGGLYMDISVILNDPLLTFYDAVVSRKAELGGFFKRESSFVSAQTPLPSTAKPLSPVIENFFLLAPKSSAIVTAWRDEYEKAVHLGFESYGRCIRQLGVKMNTRWHWSPYFAAYQALQTVLQVHAHAQPPILYLEATEDTVYKIEVMFRENPLTIFAAYRNRELMASIPYIKLPKYRRFMFPLAYFDTLPSFLSSQLSKQ